MNKNKIIGTTTLGWAGSGKSYITSKLAHSLGINFVGESEIDSIINENITNPVVRDFMLKEKEPFDLKRLKLYENLEKPFITDIHFGGIYTTFTELLLEGKESFDKIYRRISENTPENISTLGFLISPEQTKKNLLTRGEAQGLIDLMDTMLPRVEGLINYLDTHNIPNFKVIDTTNWNPFNNPQTFINQYKDFLPIK